MSQMSNLIEFPAQLYLFLFNILVKINISTTFSHVHCLQINMSTISPFSTDHCQYTTHPVGFGNL